jgi:hypothetical protein
MQSLRLVAQLMPQASRLADIKFRAVDRDAGHGVSLTRAKKSDREKRPVQPGCRPKRNFRL